MGSRTTRAHDAKARAREARAREARAVMLERQAQDERIEDAMAAALLAMDDRAAAQVLVEREERTLAVALQRLSLENVSVRDIRTVTGLGEKYVTRLLRMNTDADAETDPETDTQGEARAELGTESGRAAG
jgi:hypothetical protein